MREVRSDQIRWLIFFARLLMQSAIDILSALLEMLSHVSNLFIFIFLGLWWQCQPPPPLLPEMSQPASATLVIYSAATQSSLYFPAHSAILLSHNLPQASSSSISNLLGLLGIILQDVNVLVGLTCSLITAIGVGSSSSCNKQPIFCEKNSFVRKSPFGQW